jgi:DNA-binding transcriptional ArsR family regulator
LTSLVFIRKLKDTSDSKVCIRPLEDIFGNAVARILDFLIINEPFDYALSEISHCIDVPLDTLRKAIPELIEKGLLEEIRRKGESRNYKLNEKSNLAQSLSQYVVAKINFDIEKEKSSRRVKSKVPAPGIKGY